MTARPPRRPDRRSRVATPSVVLFASMFAAQATLLVLSPILPAMAADLGVSAAAGAQLRTVSGLVAGGTAIWLGLRARPRPLRRLLGVGLGLLAAGSAASALAPGFGALVGAQAVVGVGLGVSLSAALAAASEWAPGDARPLSWALVGQPVAWIVGMPVAGAVAEVSWRYAWAAVPLTASVVALAVLARRPRDPAPAARSGEPPIWRQPGVAGWMAGELTAYGAWAGTLVFAGALFVEAYATSSTLVGLVLAAAALAYLPGNFLARRWLAGRARVVLAGGALASAVGVAVFATVRVSVPVSAVVLAALAFAAGARTLAGSSLGLQLAPHCRLQAMSARTTAVQFGYLLGAGLGGAALAAGGYAALGLTLGALYLAAAAPHVATLWRRSPSPTGTARVDPA